MQDTIPILCGVTCCPSTERELSNTHINKSENRMDMMVDNSLNRKMIVAHNHFFSNSLTGDYKCLSPTKTFNVQMLLSGHDLSHL